MGTHGEASKSADIALPKIYRMPLMKWMASNPACTHIEAVTHQRNQMNQIKRRERPPNSFHLHRNKYGVENALKLFIRNVKIGTRISYVYEFESKLNCFISKSGIR